MFKSRMLRKSIWRDRLIEQILTVIVAIATSSVATIIIVLWFFLKNPEKVEKWASMFLKVGAYVSKKAEKRYMATNLQAIISEKRIKLGLQGDVLAYGIKIEWTDKESAETDLKENKVLVMMKPFRSQAKNFAAVVSLYVPQVVLPKSRNYVNQDLVKSIDYTIAKTILEDNPTAIWYYTNREIEEMSPESKKFLEIITPLHRNGCLTRLIIPEFQNLSNLFPIEPNKEVHEETVGFTEEVYKFETAIPPVTGSGLGIFNGKYIKIAIVPVGEAKKLQNTGIATHLTFIEKSLKNGITHFYIVSASGINYPKQLITLACKGYNLSLVFSEEYAGIYRGKKRKMFCALCSKEAS